MQIVAMQEQNRNKLQGQGHPSPILISRTPQPHTSIKSAHFFRAHGRTDRWTDKASYSCVSAIGNKAVHTLPKSRRGGQEQHSKKTLALWCGYGAPDGWTIQLTDAASSRVASPQLKKQSNEQTNQLENWQFFLPMLSDFVSFDSVQLSILSRPAYSWKSKGLEMGKEINGGKKRKKGNLGKI